MRRVMSIWFPNLPLDRRVRMGDARVDGCFAILREIKSAWRLMHLSSEALRQGLHPQMSVTDAKAIAPHLLTEKAEPEREALLLRALLRWSEAFTPWGAMDAPDGLFLDITGCAHLFGGEEAMAKHLLERLSLIKFTARIAICDTKSGAWGLARFGTETLFIGKHGQTKDALKPLPIAALNIEPNINRDLRRAGLKTIGDLYTFKTATLARRFGLEITDKLSRTLGYSPDPVSPQSADPVYSARMTLPDPIGFLNDLNHVLEKLSFSVCSRMEKARIGARRFDLTVRCVDTGDHLLSVGFARPCFEAAHIMQQFAKPLEDLKIEFGADWFRLIARHLEPIKVHQFSLDSKEQGQNSDLAHTLSTLGNRLGFDRVTTLVPRASHIPEYEYAHIEAVKRGNKSWPTHPRLRPERIYKRLQRAHIVQPGRPPKIFQWRKDIFQTVEAKGPERLTPHWWEDGDKRTRDYWIVITKTGARLWLLTYPADNHSEWFIAGRFA